MKVCIVDERISYKCERELLIEGFRIIKLPPSENLPEALASHTDILMFCHGGNIIASADYCERHPYIFSDIRELSNARLTFTDDLHSKLYPKDAIFNALVTCKMIFLKSDTVSKSILDFARRAGLRIVNTKQGYPACTALAFGRHAITADCGMERVLSENGISVLKIRNSGICLPPYEYGFIGGTAGIYKNKIYFLGDIMSHPDGEAMTEFIMNAGYIPRSLSDEPLRDLGKMFFIE